MRKFMRVLLSSLCLLVVVCLFGHGIVFGEANDPSLVMSDTTAHLGDTVTVDVGIQRNPGIIGATLQVEYDSGLTLTDIKNGAAFQPLDMTRPGSVESGCRIHWDTTEISDEEVMDGVVVSLTFVVPNELSGSGQFAVRVAPVTENGAVDVVGRDLEVVNLQPASCTIKVQQQDEPHTVHVYGDWETVVEPTCAQMGSRKKVCSVCGDTVVEDLQKLPHTWDEGEVTQEPTYDAEGVRTYTCTKCKTTRTEPIQALTKVSLEGATIDDIPNTVYSGGDITPEPTVKLDGSSLERDSDFTVSYENNRDAGTACVVVSGINKYQGTIRKEFVIEKALSKVFLEPQTVAYTSNQNVYTGQVYTGGSTGTVSFAYYSDSECKELVSTDGVSSVGEYYVQATLSDDKNYVGAKSAAVKFTVTRAKIDVPTATNCTYSGAEQVGVATGTGYTLSGTPKATNVGTYEVVATPDANHCWADGTTESKALSWKMAAENLSQANVSVIARQTFTGKALTPKPVVKLGDVTLRNCQ